VKNYNVRRYHPDDFVLWNDFVSMTKNVPFLFHRNFIEYHSNRFQDYSILVFDSEQLLAVIPANILENKLYSHQGLTYGGFVFKMDLALAEIDIIISEALCFLKENQFTEFTIKEMSPIYVKENHEEIQHFLYKKGAKSVAQRKSLIIDFNLDYKVSKSKMKHYRRLQSEGLEVKKEADFEPFWDKVLQPLLREKYNTNPLHSLEEMGFLKAKFPQNIEQYNLYLNDDILAGITVFKTNNVVKSQYGALTEVGKKYRALDYLFIYLIEKFSKKFDYFDMGTVDDDSELGYNEGLLNQKKELGCDLYNQNTYQIAL
jgi:hypothetical protein